MAGDRIDGSEDFGRGAGRRGPSFVDCAAVGRRKEEVNQGPELALFRGKVCRSP